MLPDTLAAALRAQLQHVRLLWQQDRERGVDGVWMPDALAAKYPSASRSWGWHWVFLQATLSEDPRTGVRRRHHLQDQAFQRAFRRAVQLAGIVRPATPHTLRHSFATPPAAGTLRHSHGASLAGACGREHHHDLHPRVEGGRRRRGQPAGRSGAAACASRGYPVFLNPAAIPLIDRWMPRCTRSAMVSPSTSLARWSWLLRWRRISSTCRWFNGSTYGKR